MDGICLVGSEIRKDGDERGQGASLRNLFGPKAWGCTVAAAITEE